MNFIKQAWYTLISKDDTVYPKGEATIGDKVSNFTRMSVYSIDSNPPVNSHVLLLDSRGLESNQFGLVNDFENRKKGLKEGEAVFHNTKSGAYVYLKENGNMELLASGDFAVRYAALETAFNQLKDDQDAILDLLQTWTFVAQDGGSALQTAALLMSPSTADITPAKVAEIEIPS